MNMKEFEEKLETIGLYIDRLCVPYDDNKLLEVGFWIVDENGYSYARVIKQSEYFEILDESHINQTCLEIDEIQKLKGWISEFIEN